MFLHEVVELIDGDADTSPYVDRGQLAAPAELVQSASSDREIVIAGVGIGTGIAAVDRDEGRVDISVPPHTFRVNEAGMSYGSAEDANSPDKAPDLIFAIGTTGTEGYVRKADLDEPDPRSPARLRRTFRRAGTSRCMRRTERQ